MSQSVRAILICLVAYLCFDLMSIHVRYLSASYSAQELSVYRNIFGILPSIVLLWYTRELSIRPSDYKLDQWKLALSRGFVVAIAQLMFYTALGQLELATVSALGQTNALFVVLLAILMFREKVGLWRWGAVIIGFIGAIWIVRPGTDVFSWIALLPLGLHFAMPSPSSVCVALIVRFQIRSCIYIRPLRPQSAQSFSRCSPIALAPFYPS